VTFLTWLAAATAFADDPPAEAASRAFVARPLLGRPVVELRGGVDTFTDQAVPQICGEVHPLPYLALDACGTGSGWFHQRPSDEMSHYRVEADLPLLARGRGEVWLQPGLGFAEVQRGVDAAGFRFGDEVAAGQVEAAGAEGTVSLRGRAWVHERVFAVAEANVGLAWIPGAPQAVGAAGPAVPSAGITAGLGF